MIEILYSIRYQSQLKRTRPSAIAELEKGITQAITGGGGSLRSEFNAGIAHFNDESLAFYLEFSRVLEGIAASFATASADLFGFACLVHSAAQPLENRARILRELSLEENPSGIWVAPSLAARLSGYAEFGSGDPYLPLLSLTIASSPEPALLHWDKPKVKENLEKLLSGSSQAVALVGPPLCGKRQVLRSVLDELLPSFPVARIRFGFAGNSLSCIANAVDCAVPGQVDETGWTGKPLQDVIKAIQAERLSSSHPQGLLFDSRRVFTALASAYCVEAERRGLPAFFVLENVQQASWEALEVAKDVLIPLVTDSRATLILTATSQTALSPFKDAHPVIARFDGPQRPAFNRALPRSLSPDLLEIAYALGLMRPFFTRNEIFAIFSLEGTTSETIERALLSLSEQEVIVSPDDPELIPSDFMSLVGAALGTRTELIRALVRRELRKAGVEGRIRPSLTLISGLHELGDRTDDDLTLTALEEDLVSGRGGELLEALKRGDLDSSLGTVWHSSLELILRSRELLLNPAADASDCPSLIGELEDALAAPFQTISARCRSSLLLNLAALYGWEQNWALCSAKAKEALVLLQGDSRARGLSRAYRMLALVELSRQRVSEAIDYLSFSMESAELSGEVVELLISENYAAIAQFLWGNYARAERLAIAARERSSRAYCQAWERWSRFFLARLQFEVGRYGEAAKLLELELSSLPPLSPESSVFESWLLRSRVFGNPLPPVVQEGENDHGERALFSLEQAYLSGAFDSALKVSETLLSRVDPPEFSSPDLPNWSSGFALIEGLALPSERQGKRLVASYRALSLCKLGKNVEAVAAMRAIVKDENSSELSPNDAFYHWAYSYCLGAGNASSLDQATNLSMAFKRLQRRASRIDDLDLNAAYLSLPRWNAALYADAKAGNLI